MPQLDKYIFFNQIIYLTFFFSLVYVYIRGTVVPKISTLLKYRKKRVYLFNEQINGYSKILKFSKSIFEREGKNLTNYLVDKTNNINNFYKKTGLSKLKEISLSLEKTLKENKQVQYSVARNKLELKRLKVILAD